MFESVVCFDAIYDDFAVAGSLSEFIECLVDKLICIDGNTSCSRAHSIEAIGKPNDKSAKKFFDAHFVL